MQKVENEKTSGGNIFVSHRAISTIAYQAALESYGLVGLAPKNKVSGLANALIKDPTQGVSIQYDGKKVAIDLYIVVEYGTRITSVAASVADNVRYAIEKQTGLPVLSVNVHVRGLRVSSELKA